jgi:hypothetical protein
MSSVLSHECRDGIANTAASFEAIEFPHVVPGTASGVTPRQRVKPGIVQRIGDADLRRAARSLPGDTLRARAGLSYPRNLSHRPPAFCGEMKIVEPTRSLGQDRNACDESHLNLPHQNVGISRHAYQRMSTLGISSEMVVQTLNAPDRVQRLPLSTVASYFGEFDGRTIRVMTTLDELVIAVSWTSNRADINND